MPYVTLIITIPLTIFAVLFAISNGDDITLGLWPFDAKYTTPTYLFGLVMLGGGFFLGALFIWLLSQKTRLRLWQESRKTARLEKELDALHAKTKDPAPAALPAK